MLLNIFPVTDKYNICTGVSVNGWTRLVLNIKLIKVYCNKSLL